jgi:hypothetical protein
MNRMKRQERDSPQSSASIKKAEHMNNHALPPSAGGGSTSVASSLEGIERSAAFLSSINSCSKFVLVDRPLVLSKVNRGISAANPFDLNACGRR